MTYHRFSAEIAAEVGVNAALVFDYIAYKLKECRGKKAHICGGFVFFYANERMIAGIYPYLSTVQVKLAVEKLLAADYIIRLPVPSQGRGKYGYSITDKGMNALKS